jgi:hypothetical protein
MHRIIVSLSILLVAGLAQAHVGNHPSVHDTVAGIIQRFQKTIPAEELKSITVEKVIASLTPEEREILGQEHLTFRVNVPVTVYVCRVADMKEQVFWLAERGFENTGLKIATSDNTFDAWQKNFPAGEIGLGVNSLSGDGDHYFVALAPQQAGDRIEVSEIYPGQHTVGVMNPGEKVYVSWDETTLKEVPAPLSGQVLLRGNENARRSARLTSIYATTKYPATAVPDQVVLTWASDPKTTQAIQWRTSTETAQGQVRYRIKKTAGAELADPWVTVAAETVLLENHNTVNDPLCHRHSVNLVGLEPGTTYEYEVGDGSVVGWSTPYAFTTAPDAVTPFKFVYMGDAQNGLDAWGRLVHNAYAAEPEAAFYIMAGDLVNRGNQRDDWDDFFHNAAGVYENRQLVPCIGNHEVQGDEGPWMYLSLFDLPENGPTNVAPERAYSFTYSNALFVILDSNLAPADQVEWLDEQLAKSDATWKFAVYHHPAYSSGANRNNAEVRELWGALFDKYHVDLALQGHDHAYLRTWPMKGEKQVATPAEGTIYIVSVSGTKFYDQGDFDYTEFGMTNVATYQVLDLRIDGNTLTYKAYDIEGKVRDEFVIKK